MGNPLELEEKQEQVLVPQVQVQAQITETPMPPPEQAPSQPQPQPSPAPTLPSQEPDFLSWYGASIEQAHDSLEFFSGPSLAEPSQPAAPEPVPSEEPAETGGLFSQKNLLLIAGGLLALAGLVFFARRFLGRQDDDSSWRRPPEPEYPPTQDSGGAANVPSENSNPKTMADITAIALGQWK